MAAMCSRCARKLQYLRIPWLSSVRSLCAAPSKSPSFQVDEYQRIESSFAEKRDPMAVLKALASTVKPAARLPNPEFIEDVVLLPRSKAMQEACIEAKKSGREAAEFVISRCPGIFPLREPNPVWISENLKVAEVKTEKELKCFIKAADAKNAILAYERLKKQGVEVSLNTQNKILDLAAHRLGNFPAKQVVKDELILPSMQSEETKMASADEDTNDSDSDVPDQENDNSTTSEVAKDNPVTREWRSDNYALQMFHNMTTKNARTYETMVLGFLQYRCYYDAYTLFKEMRQLGYQASLFTYNLLFKAVARSNHIDSKWEEAKVLIRNMGEEPVVLPNLKTYNTLMKVVVVSSEQEMSRTDLALGLIRDMIAAGLEPSLESYNQLIRAEYMHHWEEKKIQRSQNVDWRRKINELVSPMILNKIITHLESLPKIPPLKDPEDAFFFRSAMSAALLCKDAKLAIRIYNLLQKQNNTSYLGSKHGPFYLRATYKQLFQLTLSDGSFKLKDKTESSAFLLTLASAEADFSTIYSYYREFVPHKFRPKEHIYTSLFNLASRTNNVGVVKGLYEDMRKHRVQLTTTVASAMFRALGATTDPKHIQSNLDTMLDVLRWMKMYRVEITHVIITQLIRMYCRNDQLEDAWEALDMFQSSRIAIPTYTALNDILLKASEEMDDTKVVSVFEMMAKYGYNLNRKRRLVIYSNCNLPTPKRGQIDMLFSDMSILDERRRQYFPVKQEEKTEEIDLID